MKKFASNVHWLLVVAAISLTSLSCGPGKGLNFFSVEDDIALGKQVKAEIESNPSEFPLLPEAGNEQVYSYVRSLANTILNSGRVENRNVFAWEIKIIDDDETLNAFCTPGGYIYVYTGLIKFLDSEDQLMGVIGHEIAHAAMRHSTRQLTQLYGLQFLGSILTDSSEPGLIEKAKQVALSLASLKFSRTHETEADNRSVLYMCNTSRNAAGAAGFFKKIQDKSGAPPQFLSTHPDPGNRVQNIEALSKDLNCSGNEKNISKYASIKAML